MAKYTKGMEVSVTHTFESDTTLDSGFEFIARIIPKKGKLKDQPSYKKGKRHRVEVPGPASVIIIQADGCVKVLE